MGFRLSSIIVLVALLLQSAFGGLTGHFVVPVADTQHCGHTDNHHHHDAEHQHCSHHHHHHHEPHQHDGQDGQCCTSSEPTVVHLLTLPRTTDDDVVLPIATVVALVRIETDEPLFRSQDQQPIWHEDPGGNARLASLRSIRLLL